jgi:hypothetical protein
MAAVGVRASLAVPTATRTMTWTIGSWLASLVVVPFLAGTILAAGALVYLAFSTFTLWLSPSAPMAFVGRAGLLSVLWPIVNDAVTALIAVLIVVETRLRFDRLAVRMAGGPVEAAVDALIHGAPGRRPVRLGAGSSPSKPRRDGGASSWNDEPTGADRVGTF